MRASIGMLAGMDTDAGLSALTPSSAQRPSTKPAADADDRQQPRFDEQLTRDRGAARAERRAQRDFLLAIDRAGQQQLADVDARDQQHDADRREQQQERRTRRADDRLPAPARPRACVPPARRTTTRPPAAGCSAGGVDAAADHVEIGARPRDADARLEAGRRRASPDRPHAARAAPGTARRE